MSHFDCRFDCFRVRFLRAVDGHIIPILRITSTHKILRITSTHKIPKNVISCSQVILTRTEYAYTFRLCSTKKK
nr:MAG TPA: hypothetical protein [Caudoviricetes sp.]